MPKFLSICLCGIGVLIAAFAAGRLLTGPEEAGAEATASQPQPRAVVEEFNVDFGEIDVDETARHSFVVRNEGLAPLTLKVRDTSCKCTLAKLDSAEVAPGESTLVELEWKSSEPTENFFQGARIETNDPELRRFDLRVEGRIRCKLRIFPELLFFSEMRRGEERVMPTVLYSQAYDDVRITRIESTYAGLSARVVDGSTPDAPKPDTRFIRDFELVCKPGMKVGPFHGKIIIDYEAADRTGAEHTGQYVVEFLGETVGDVSLHGRNVVGRILNLNTVSQAVGTKERAYIHLRGDAGNTEFTVGSVNPDFVEVRLLEPEKLSEKMTRVPVEVSIPPGSPLVSMSSADVGLGEVKLLSNHPDYPEVRFNLALVMTP